MTCKMEPEKQMREFNVKDISSILGQAERLKAFEEAMNSSELSHRVESVLTDLDKDKQVSEEFLYVVAKDFGIPQEYVDRIVKVRYPSDKQMKWDLQDFDAKPTVDVVLNNYKKALSATLLEKSPETKFECVEKNEHTLCTYNMSLSIYELKGLRQKHRWWVPKFLVNENDEKVLAFILFGSGVNDPTIFFTNVHVYDPAFLSMCGKTLDKLKSRRHSGIYDMTYHYHLPVIG